jgi:lipoprotein-anchoring transpeptidase ErfK/SrfK
MNGSNCIRILMGLGALSCSLGLQLPAAHAEDGQPFRLATLQGLTPPGAIPAQKAKKSSGDRSAVSLAGYSPGTIVVKTRERRLYYITGNGTAVRYPVGVGRPDKQWTGQSAISGKYIKPAWSPPEEIIRDNPNISRLIPGGTPNNPMGAAAMTIAGGEYAIHGTNRPGSVGGFVSYGCIRMLNADILDLFARVSVGTPVVVER